MSNFTSTDSAATAQNMYITVSYDLYVDNAEGTHEIIETAPAEHPYQFISGMGETLEAFEAKMTSLHAGDTFDFVLPVDLAYGPFYEEAVTALDKSLFMNNGRFDKENIYPGNVIGLSSPEGDRYDALITEVTEDKVHVNLNHPLAGKDLHFVGKVITSRLATEEEVKALIQRMTGHEDSCGCGSCGCEGDDAGHSHHGGCGGSCGCSH